MDIGAALRDARRRSALSQAELAQRASTSQATVSAYERGRKEPSVETLQRLLAACGVRLTVAPAATTVVHPTPAQLARAGRTLVDVLRLAEALPTRHEPRLRFPVLGSRS